MAILETIADVGSAITNVVELIFDAFVNVHDALNEFYNMLKDFNQTVIAITKDPSTGTGLPVVESIGVFRYLVGDPAFFVIYMVILFGCLFLKKNISKKAAFIIVVIFFVFGYLISIKNFLFAKFNLIISRLCDIMKNTIF